MKELMPPIGGKIFSEDVSDPRSFLQEDEPLYSEEERELLKPFFPRLFGEYNQPKNHLKWISRLQEEAQQILIFISTENLLISSGFILSENKKNSSPPMNLANEFTRLGRLQMESKNFYDKTQIEKEKSLLFKKVHQNILTYKKDSPKIELLFKKIFDCFAVAVEKNMFNAVDNEMSWRINPIVLYWANQFISFDAPAKKNVDTESGEQKLEASHIDWDKASIQGFDYKSIDGYGREKLSFYVERYFDIVGQENSKFAQHLNKSRLINFQIDKVIPFDRLRNNDFSEDSLNSAAIIMNDINCLLKYMAQVCPLYAFYFLLLQKFQFDHDGISSREVLPIDPKKHKYQIHLNVNFLLALRDENTSNQAGVKELNNRSSKKIKKIEAQLKKDFLDLEEMIEAHLDEDSTGLDLVEWHALYAVLYHEIKDRQSEVRDDLISGSFLIGGVQGKKKSGKKTKQVAKQTVKQTVKQTAKQKTNQSVKHTVQEKTQGEVVLSKQTDESIIQSPIEKVGDDLKQGSERLDFSSCENRDYNVATETTTETTTETITETITEKTEKEMSGGAGSEIHWFGLSAEKTAQDFLMEHWRKHCELSHAISLTTDEYTGMALEFTRQMNDQHNIYLHLSYDNRYPEYPARYILRGKNRLTGYRAIISASNFSLISFHKTNRDKFTIQDYEYLCPNEYQVPQKVL